MRQARSRLSLASFALLVPLFIACSSSPLTEVDRDSATPDELGPDSHESPSTSPQCGECVTQLCSSSYQRCLSKDPNGCANLDMCVRRCSVASCTYDCGGYWAVSPEATDYYGCISTGCDACFQDAAPDAVHACETCLQSCHGQPNCCAGAGCLCEAEC